MPAPALPDRLAAVAAAFRAVPAPLALELLLEHADGLPPLPDALRDRPDLFERVTECQTPFFVATEVGADDRVRMHFDAPEESPTTRGFAGILHRGLDGATTAEVLAVPGDFANDLGLAKAISPLRLRGMAAILARVQRQVRTATERSGGPAA
ncbi:MAG: SufE family protein [Trueperaceae bacterium]